MRCVFKHSDKLAIQDAKRKEEKEKKEKKEKEEAAKGKK